MMAYLMKDGYGDICERSRIFARSLCPRIEQSVQQVLAKSAAERTFFVSDFGVADGASSSIYLRRIAEIVAKTGGLSEISLTLEDQEENDFRPVFVSVREALNGLSGSLNVLISTVGKSFFEQCVPAASTHFAISMLSAQYLDTSRPLDSFQTGYSFPLLRRWHDAGRDKSVLTEADQAQFEANAAKAATDWERFLLLRAKELRVGGRLFVTATVNVPRTSDYFQEHRAGVLFDLYDEWSMVIDAVRELVEAGEITNEEEENFVIPKHLRSPDEMKIPFLAEGSSVRRAGLRLVACDFVVNKHPQAIQSTASLSEDELQRRVSSFLRELFCYRAPLLEMVLSKSPGRTTDDVVRLVAAVFQRVEKALLTSKALERISNMSCVLEAQKVSEAQCNELLLPQ